MGIKMYLASRFGRQAELRKYRELLQQHGIEVTSSWLDVERDEQAAVHTDEELAAAAAKNLADIGRADILTVFTDRDEGYERGGHHVELGAALASDHAVVLVGPRINVFHYHEEINHFETVEAWLAWSPTDHTHNPGVPYTEPCARCGKPEACKLRYPELPREHKHNGYLRCKDCRGGR